MNIPVADHILQAYCPKCHYYLYIEIDKNKGENRFHSWEEMRKGKLITCNGCGQISFVRPVMQVEAS